jgi:putative hydrolase of HD superfamily
MPKLELDPILQFEELLHKFALVERVAHIKGRTTRENDVEHSYIITMLAWFVIDTFKLSLDTNKVLRYALVHDLVEVYAGTPISLMKKQRKQNTKEKKKLDYVLLQNFLTLSV